MISFSSAPQFPPDVSVKVTKIGNRWHARLFFNGAVFDEMACKNRQDIGYICRTMLRWFDKTGGGSLFAERARHRLNTKQPFGHIDTIWYRNQLESNKLKLKRKPRIPK